MADNFITCHYCNLILPLTNIKNIFIIKSGTFCHKIEILDIACRGKYYEQIKKISYYNNLCDMCGFDYYCRTERRDNIFGYE